MKVEAGRQVLLVEDDDDVVQSIGQLLTRNESNEPFWVTRVRRLEEALKAVQSRIFDVAILDLSLPDSKGYTTFETFRRHVPAVPVLILADFYDRELTARREDVRTHDYLLKSHLRSYPLDRTILHVIERARAAAKLDESRERYQLLFESIPIPCFVYDTKTLAVLAVNDAAVQVHGWSREEFQAMTLKDFRPPEDVPALMGLMEHIDEIPQTCGTWRHLKKDGTILYVEAMSRPFVFNGQKARIAVVTDVTERERRGVGVKLRESLQNVQEMSEALAQMAAALPVESRKLVLDLREEVLRMTEVVEIGTRGAV
jgi:PAS domain S-box-containing protein